MKLSPRLAFLALLGGVTVAAGALAQGEGYLAPARSVGDYAGVSPGGTNPPPSEARARRAGAALVTWPGFDPELGGGRFFLQLTAPVESTTQASPGRFEVILRNVGTHVRNTRRPLITRFHDTPVDQARVERRGRQDLAFVFTLRRDVRPSVRQADGPGGYRYLFIDWPEGQYLPAQAYRRTASAPAQLADEDPYADDEVPPPIQP
ncbi:MAG: hypothetical protein AAF447_13190 [Myxococcota bacterium]